MRGDIKFNQDTCEAMFALLRFINYEHRDHFLEKKTILDFMQFVSKNRLTSPVITKCQCTHGISNDEVIFNVCETCKGVVSEDFLSGIPKA